MRRPTSRRAALAVAAGAASLPSLVACGQDAESGDSPKDGRTAEAQDPPHRGARLLDTADIEVGGARFLDSPSIVVTQPRAGEFHAFDRTCTHSGCPVQELIDGRITCTCHGSAFDATTGRNVAGPARRPLTPFAITVDGDAVTAG